MSIWILIWTEAMIHRMRKLSSSCRVSLKSRMLHLRRSSNQPVKEWRKLITRGLCSNSWESWLRKKHRDSSNWAVTLTSTTMMTFFRRFNFWCHSGRIRELHRFHPLNLRTRLHLICRQWVFTRIFNSSQLRVAKDSRSRQLTNQLPRLILEDPIQEREDDLIISLKYNHY